MNERKIIIKDGEVHFIYGDDMQPFLDLGLAEVRRASHVEPVNIDGEVKWEADMSPLDGPLLGPFDTRTIALKKEVDWLNANNLGVK